MVPHFYLSTHCSWVVVRHVGSQQCWIRNAFFSYSPSCHCCQSICHHCPSTDYVIYLPSPTTCQGTIEHPWQLTSHITVKLSWWLLTVCLTKGLFMCICMDMCSYLVWGRIAVSLISDRTTAQMTAQLNCDETKCTHNHTTMQANNSTSRGVCIV